MKPRREVFFATCAPGIESTLHAEVKALRLARAEQQVGGVYFEGTIADAWRANLELRTAVRVLWRIHRGEERIHTDDELYAAISSLDWLRFLSVGSTFAVSVQSSESKLDHTLFIAQRTKDAIVDQLRDALGSRPSVDKENPDLSVHVHLSRDRLTVSLDTSGASLHKRGWRRYQGKAPLSETLAAGLVLLSEWDRRSPLVDPFCGSGTILIEAALLAAGAAPGRFRESFAFERLPGHDARAWKKLRDAARGPVTIPKKLILRGYDRDPERIEGARENLAAAGLTDHVQLEVRDARAVEWRRGWNAWILTNPPYGERVGNEDQLRAIYRTLGEQWRAQCDGYHLALLSGNPSLTEELGIVPDARLGLKNGNLDCELFCAHLGRNG